MTQDILEGNKIIDKFINTGGMNVSRNIRPSEMEYHSSWDWLMPAYRKFRSLTGMKMPEWLIHCNNIENWIIRVNIIEAHKSITEAIKWYNEQHQMN